MKVCCVATIMEQFSQHALLCCLKSSQQKTNFAPPHSESRFYLQVEAKDSKG